MTSLAEIKVKRQAKIRRKLLSLLSRSTLEYLSEMETPWHANRPDLVERVIKLWPHDEIEEAIIKLIKSAE